MFRDFLTESAKEKKISVQKTQETDWDGSPKGSLKVATVGDLIKALSSVKNKNIPVSIVGQGFGGVITDMVEVLIDKGSSDISANGGVESQLEINVKNYWG